MPTHLETSHHVHRHGYEALKHSSSSSGGYRAVFSGIHPELARPLKAATLYPGPTHMDPPKPSDEELAIPVCPCGQDRMPKALLAVWKGLPGARTGPIQLRTQWMHGWCPRSLLKAKPHTGHTRADHITDLISSSSESHPRIPEIRGSAQADGGRMLSNNSRQHKPRARPSSSYNIYSKDKLHHARLVTTG